MRLPLKLSLIALLNVMDNGCVFMGDSRNGVAPGTIKRKKGKKSGEVLVVKTIKALKDYNDFMGGVDQWDQLRCGTLGITMRGRRSKWTVRYFEGVLDIIKVQAFRVWCIMHKGTDQELTHHEATLKLQEWLCSNFQLDREEEVEGGGPAVPQAADRRTIPTIEKATGASRKNSNKLQPRVCVVCKDRLVKSKVGYPEVRTGALTTHRCAVCKAPVCNESTKPSCIKMHLEGGSDRGEKSKCSGVLASEMDVIQKP